MKICVAQIQSKLGKVQENIEKHKNVIELAASNDANFIIFPELSLTGYLLAQAKEFAFTPNDPSLLVFQEMSNVHQITIGVGMPTKIGSKINISLLLFRPNQSSDIYSKKYLHHTEENYFASGEDNSNLKISKRRIAFAICYEISVPEHTESALKDGAEIYIASVAKSPKGVEVGERRLAKIAKEYGVPVLMSNSVGQSDGFVSAGKTAVWDQDGEVVDQLDAHSEGILIYDTNTNEIAKKIL